MQKIYFFLFGETASRLYEHKGGVDAVIANKTHVMFDVFKHDETVSPIQLLDAFDGWNGYVEITESEYEQLKKAKSC